MPEVKVVDVTKTFAKGKIEIAEDRGFKSRPRLQENSIDCSFVFKINTHKYWRIFYPNILRKV